MSRYVAHLALLTVPVWSPLHRKVWYITPNQYRLMARIYSGRRFTLRSLASELGYSLAGLHDALQALVTGGLVTVQTRLGCKGWTFAKVRPGAVVTEALSRIKTLVGNVRSLGTTSSRSSPRDVSTSPNIQQTGPSGPSGEGCMGALTGPVESFASIMARFGYRQ